MEGFDYARAAAVVAAPEGFAVEVMVAIGHPGSVSDLPEHLQPREAPNGRDPVTSLAFPGRFPG
jgi:hypothetical protein